jgi:hypothetical protein
MLLDMLLLLLLLLLANNNSISLLLLSSLWGLQTTMAGFPAFLLVLDQQARDRKWYYVLGWRQRRQREQ